MFLRSPTKERHKMNLYGYILVKNYVTLSDSATKLKSKYSQELMVAFTIFLGLLFAD